MGDEAKTRHVWLQPFVLEGRRWVASPFVRAGKTAGAARLGDDGGSLCQRYRLVPSAVFILRAGVGKVDQGTTDEGLHRLKLQDQQMS